MQDERYRNQLEESAKALVGIRGVLFEVILGIVLQGDLREWNDLVEVGEMQTFSKDFLKASEDVNVQLLTKLLDNIESSYFSFININNLKDPHND